MSEKCPVYLGNNCVLKSLFTKHFNANIFGVELKQLDEKYQSNCEGLIAKCCFGREVATQQEDTEEQKKEEPQHQEVVEETPEVKVSIHQIENPYMVKADILVYPSNNVLTIDDPLLNRLSYNGIQKECDKIAKPINMGSVYVTSNGGENSKVQAKKIIHAVVAGESRLVNEADIKLAIRKALHLAKESNARNIVMLPPDCGTHDIQDAARVHLSSIFTFLQAEKDITFKNIFIVMEDKESYEVYQEYYKRVFKSR
jgi:O-acetyl-ADP-ribose deacetylase (regulator of RNase III)